MVLKNEDMEAVRSNIILQMIGNISYKQEIIIFTFQIYLSN